MFSLYPIAHDQPYNWVRHLAANSIKMAQSIDIPEHKENVLHISDDKISDMHNYA